MNDKVTNTIATPSYSPGYIDMCKKRVTRWESSNPDKDFRSAPSHIKEKIKHITRSGK